MKASPEGFEPSTPGLKGQCSNRAELRALLALHNNILQDNILKHTLNKKKNYFLVEFNGVSSVLLFIKGCKTLGILIEPSAC